MKVNFCSKKVVSFIFSFGIGFLAFAYNPPVQGENYTGFINPFQMTRGNSTAGGAIFTVSPSSVMINPALSAYQNRVTLDLSYTGIVTKDDNSPYAQSFGTGLLVPTKWCSISGELFGNFSKAEKLDFGDSMNVKVSVAKEVAENFAIGAGVSGGVLWNRNTDWNLSAELGAVYKWGSLGPMRNFRLGASVLNIGKVYNNTYTQGIWGRNNIGRTDWTSYPGFMMMRAGAAAEFVNKENFVLGLSLDISTPFFQNMIVDAGVQMNIIKFINVNSSWQLNMQEASAGYFTWLPSVGVSFKFAIGTKFLKNENWQKSDFEAGLAWKNVNSTVNAFSAGTIINLGQPDRKAPVINVGVDEEEE